VGLQTRRRRRRNMEEEVHDFMQLTEAMDMVDRYNPKTKESETMRGFLPAMFSAEQQCPFLMAWIFQGETSMQFVKATHPHHESYVLHLAGAGLCKGPNIDAEWAKLFASAVCNSTGHETYRPTPVPQKDFLEAVTAVNDYVTELCKTNAFRVQCAWFLVYCEPRENTNFFKCFSRGAAGKDYPIIPFLRISFESMQPKAPFFNLEKALSDATFVTGQKDTFVLQNAFNAVFKLAQDNVDALFEAPEPMDIEEDEEDGDSREPSDGESLGESDSESGHEEEE
jgi:hypothetical protein